MTQFTQQIIDGYNAAAALVGERNLSALGGCGLLAVFLASVYVNERWVGSIFDDPKPAHPRTPSGNHVQKHSDSTAKSTLG
jgi:hypothetical protein